MAIYQLRLSEPRDLERWVDEVSWMVWHALTPCPGATELAPHAFVRIHEIVHETCHRQITTYRSCGLQPLCRTETKPGPWMKPEAYHPDETRVRWYILRPPEGLEAMATEMAEQIAELITATTGGAVPHAVAAQAAAHGIRQGMGPYLYEHARCGTHACCQTAVPMDPWDSKALPRWIHELRLRRPPEVRDGPGAARLAVREIG